MMETEIDVTEEVRDKWQKILNVIAKLLNVPTSLIMKLSGPDIMVYLAGQTGENPYKPGDKEHFEDSGLYCETVIKSNKMLLVPDALSDEHWKNNPDVKLNMISYLGLPIKYPDNSPFGTICVLDDKTNSYSELYIDLVSSFRDTIEKDIELLYYYQLLKEKNLKLREYVNKIKSLLSEKEALLTEVHHRIKNNISSVQSLLNMQMQSVKNPEAITVLKNTIGQVKNMRLLYENLLISKDYQELSSKEYLEKLIDSIIGLYADKKKIKVIKRIEDFHMGSSSLFLLGIIINELLTNSMKYAFEDDQQGKIEVSLTCDGGKVTLQVRDNGKGLPASFDMKKTTGFGITLVDMLSKQLKGNYKIETENGTKNIIEFAL
jgi:two-component sensor histidine kinase